MPNQYLVVARPPSSTLGDVPLDLAVEMVLDLGLELAVDTRGM